MRKHTKRKVWLKVNPIEHATYQASKLTIEEWNTQMAPVITALDRLSRGDWDKLECWQPIFECLNRIESMITLNRVDAMHFVKQAQAAMVAALDRQKQKNTQAFKAEELATLREVVNVYGDLLKEVTHAQFKRATDHTNANVTRILSNKSKMTNVNDCVFE